MSGHRYAAPVTNLLDHQGERCRFEALEPRVLLSVAASGQAVELFETSPAVFIANRGQWADESVRFVHQGKGASVAHTIGGTVFELFRPVGDEQKDDIPLDPRREREPVAMESLRFSASFDNARAVRPVGVDRASGRYNFLVGDPSQHRTGVPGYETVAYKNLYRGIDLHTRGQRDSLKYEFHVAPGSNYRRISISYEGVEGLSIQEDGSLRIDLPGDWPDVVDGAPYIYQVIDGEQVEVAGRYVLIDSDTYGFEVTGRVDPTRELVIDPDLAWSTFLGGSSYEEGHDIATDSAGNILVTGSSWTPGWTGGGFDSSYNGQGDAFVTKLSPSGAHIWSTYLGGEETEDGRGIAIDAEGNIYAAGQTWSWGWTIGGFATSMNGAFDAYLVKLSTQGEHIWSTYLGDAGISYAAYGVTTDAAGNVLVTGSTRYDAGVAKLSPSGALLWSTYVGESANTGWSIATDTIGNAYVTGSGSRSSTTDYFVLKLSPRGARLWSTRFPGSLGEPSGVAIDPAGNVVVTGTTGLWGWVRGGFDTSYNGGGTDAFIAKLTPAGAQLWSTFLGGTGWDWGADVACDSAGNIYLTGSTTSSDWPLGGFTAYRGRIDAFVVKLTPQGTFVWAKDLGGGADDYGRAITVDADGSILNTGWAYSSFWPNEPYHAHAQGDIDAFLIKIRSEIYSPDHFDANGGDNTPNLARFHFNNDRYRFHTIHNADDVDWIQFYVPQTSYVAIRAVHGGLGGVGDVRLRLYGPKGHSHPTTPLRATAPGWNALAVPQADRPQDTLLVRSGVRALTRGWYWVRADGMGSAIAQYGIRIHVRPVPATSGVQVAAAPPVLNSALLALYARSQSNLHRPADDMDQGDDDVLAAVPELSFLA